MRVKRILAAGVGILAGAAFGFLTWVQTGIEGTTPMRTTVFFAIIGAAFAYWVTPRDSDEQK